MAQTGPQSLFAAKDLVIQGDAAISGSCTIGGTFRVGGVLSASVNVPSPMQTSILSGIGNTLSVPGCYYYQSFPVQALMPSASLLPGAMFVFSPVNVAPLASLGGTNIILTGSAVRTAGASTTSFFQQLSGSGGGTGVKVGNNLTTATSGSVGLMSDGIMWNVLFSSGSVTLS